MTRLLVGVVLAALLVGCSTTPAKVHPAVAVDTPQLRALKAKAQIQDCPRPSAPKAANGLPDVTLPCLGGGNGITLARLRGPLVVNLFAQWCGPCRSELPKYAAFARRHQGKVGVLGVDWQDTQPSSALRLAASSGVHYPLVADPDRQIRGNALPQLILIDAEGDVAFHQYVEIKSVAQLESLVTKHLGVIR